MLKFSAFVDLIKLEPASFKSYFSALAIMQNHTYGSCHYMVGTFVI